MSEEATEGKGKSPLGLGAWAAIFAAVLAVVFLAGYWASSGSGIQPGYFEKADAPAYGVGGGTESVGAGLGEEFEEHFKSLYEDDEE